MKRFEVMVPDWTFEVEADSKEDAIRKAIEWVQKNVSSEDILVIGEVEDEPS